jgi:ATP-dependent DNA helicase RecG
VLARLGIRTLWDLLLTLPRAYSDRTTVTPIADLVPGRPALVVARVERATVRRRPRSRPDTLAQVRDASGALAVVWWGQPYMLRLITPGRRVLLFGDVASFRHRLTMNSPELEVLPPEPDDLAIAGGIVPIYGLTEGLSQRALRELVRRVLPLAAACEETLPASVREAHGLMPLAAALTSAHEPPSLAAADLARRRLAFDEFLELFAALGWQRRRRRQELAGFIQRPGARFAAARAALPFVLTGAQERVLAEILADMAAPSPMHRLLEGEVGSGKTVVAFLAALAAIDSGQQAAIMAPTEILAQQHMRTALRLLPGIRPLLLTGAAGLRERKELLAAMARGDGELAIGTHALFSADVRFRRLGLVVVDEQHRFGVNERAALAAKGRWPDLLVMTATPIPRSLALTVFGDLDLSLVEERPPGRRPARTHVVETTRRAEVYSFLAERLARGEQAFVITPRVEADPSSELAAATERARELTAHPLLGRHAVGLLHGRLESRAKEAAMADFRRGATRLLVATTVVEVGVDVSTVTVMVIEHPERFGLSQLHQLRGRVGRGERAARAILLVDPALDPEARARLDAFARTDDGFAVADLDLAARGPGALLGEEQHGFGAFRVANLLRDRDLIERARRAAEEILTADSTLAGHPALARAIARRGALGGSALAVQLAG